MCLVKIKLLEEIISSKERPVPLAKDVCKDVLALKIEIEIGGRELRRDSHNNAVAQQTTTCTLLIAVNTGLTPALTNQP